MDKKLGVIAIVVEDLQSTEQLNSILHDYAGIIVGRMGVPYPSRGVSIISVLVDGHPDEISAVTGKIGKLSGVTVKSALAKSYTD